MQFSIRHFLFVIASVAASTIGVAQTLHKEITLAYKISVSSTDEKTDLAKSLEGANLIVRVKGTQTRSDMQSPIGSESSLYDTRSGKGFILKEYSGQKLLITLTSDNWKQKNNYYRNLVFDIDPRTEQLAGYRVKKATAMLPNGKKFIVYFTPDHVLANTEYNNAFTQLPGIPVRYELESGNLLFGYELDKLSIDPISASMFELPRNGVRIMTYEENQQLKRGDKR